MADLVEQETKNVSVDELTVYPGNPWIGDVSSIAESIRANGFYGSVIVQKSSGYILAGNHRAQAAFDVGLKEVPCTIVDVDDERASRINIADNRTGQKGNFNDPLLYERLSELSDVQGTGFNEDDMAEIIARMENAEQGDKDPDETPDKPDFPVCEKGDIWTLGEHRILCGDTTDSALLFDFIGGKEINLLLTDPPYGVDYSGHRTKREKFQNDDAGNLGPFLADSFSSCDSVMVDGCPVYTFHAMGNLMITFWLASEEVGWINKQSLVWVKQGMVVGRSDYHYQHELILYGYKPGVKTGRGGMSRESQEKNSHNWYGGNNQVSVFEYDRAVKNRGHSIGKPVSLLERLLKNSSTREDVVLDCFLGSGSTLIACERLGRPCRGVELEPAYVDTSINRWQDYTGLEATDHNGETFNSRKTQNG